MLPICLLFFHQFAINSDLFFSHTAYKPFKVVINRSAEANSNHCCGKKILSPSLCADYNIMDPNAIERFLLLQQGKVMNNYLIYFSSKVTFKNESHWEREHTDSQ